MNALALFIFLISFSGISIAKDPTPVELEESCRDEVKSGRPGNMMKLGRYFIPIKLGNPYVEIYPKSLAKMTKMEYLKGISSLDIINLDHYEIEIIKDIAKLKKNEKDNLDLIQMYGLLKILLPFAKNPKKLSQFPCLSLFFKECTDTDERDRPECIKAHALSMKKIIDSKKDTQLNLVSDNEFILLNDLQEYFGLHGDLSRWAIIPPFESEEEKRMFLANSMGEINDTPEITQILSKRFGIGNQSLLFPKIYGYFPDEPKTCFKDLTPEEIKENLDSHYYKNECFIGSYLHPVLLLKNIAKQLFKDQISINLLEKVNGSYLFHGTTSRFLAYAFKSPGKTLKKDDFIIRSRMKFDGKNRLIGQHKITKTQENQAWISVSTISGFQKAFAYSGVYKTSGNSFHYGPPYPDRLVLSGFGFQSNAPDYEKMIAERKINEDEELKDISDPMGKEFFTESFPLAFGFKIPKSYLTSKLRADFLNEVMLFSGVPLKLLKLIVVPRKYLQQIKSFLVGKGNFSEVNIIAFEDLLTPIKSDYFSNQISKYKKLGKEKRVQEYEECARINEKLSR